MNEKVPKFRAHLGLNNRKRKKSRKVQSWRYPRGIDRSLSSKRGPMPKIGYGSKKSEKQKHPCNLKEVLVCSKTDLLNIQDQEVAVRFSKRLGSKKKLELTALANEKNLKILN